VVLGEGFSRSEKRCFLERKLGGRVGMRVRERVIPEVTSNSVVDSPVFAFMGLG
jgi:hypothetical protein